MREEVRPPDGFEDLGLAGPTMSNFLWKIDPVLAEILKGRKAFGHHAAKEFYGDVWWQDGAFHEAVYRHHTFVGHHTAPTLGELMTKVNDVHGWE